MKLEILPPIPAGENPYLHDRFHCGQAINGDVEVMFQSASKPTTYLIIVNKTTGERVRVIIDEEKSEDDIRISNMMSNLL